MIFGLTLLDFLLVAAVRQLRRHRVPAGTGGQRPVPRRVPRPAARSRCGCCRSAIQQLDQPRDHAAAAHRRAHRRACSSWPPSARRSPCASVAGCARRLRVKPARSFDAVLGAVAVVAVGCGARVVHRRRAARRCPRADRPGHRRVPRAARHRPVGPPADLQAVRRLPRGARPRGLPAGVRRARGRAASPRSRHRTQRGRADRGRARRGRARSSRSPGWRRPATAARRAAAGSWPPGRVVTNAHVVAGMAPATLRVQGTGRVVRRARRRLRPQARPRRAVACPACPPRRCDLGTELEPRRRRRRRRLPARRALPPRRGPGPRGRRRPGLRHLRHARHRAARSTRSTPGCVPATPAARCCPPTASVVGVVFAKSLDDDSTGYALTLDEARPVLDEAASSAPRRSSTGACVAG